MTQGNAGIARRDAEATPQSATRVSLIDAAERLFAERGIAAVSLRLITASVGANVAAINYHFGSKESLIAEVFARRARAIADERLRLLDRARAEPASGDRLERIIAAFLEPGFFGGGDATPEGAALYARFRARLVIEASDLARRLMADHFNQSSASFLQAFREELPALSSADVEWRFHALLSVMVYTMANPGRIQALTAGDCDPADPRAALGHLVPALAGMFRAPASLAGAAPNPQALMEETQR